MVCKEQQEETVHRKGAKDTKKEIIQKETSGLCGSLASFAPLR
jgi:hypothetical protein